MKLALAALIALGSSRMVGSRPEFPLRLTRIDGDVDEVLLQVYDPGRKRWVGWGLFRLERDGEGRALSGRVVFRAPREGEWRLRAVARAKSGRIEKELKAAFEATAVYDATPPRGAVWCDEGAVVWASSEGGRARVEAAEGGVWVGLGRDLPATGSLSAPLRPGQRVRVTISDEAGNSTVTEAVSALRPARGASRGAGGPPSGSPDPFSYVMLARGWMELGMNSRAEETLRLGLRASPRNGTLAVELATLLVRRGRAADALRVLDGFEGLAASLAAAEAHAELGNVARAVVLAEKVVEAAPAGSELQKKAEALLKRLEKGE